MVIERKLILTNFTIGRRGLIPMAIVNHVIEGSLEAADSWFRNPASRVSAHYGVSRKGRIIQWVTDEDTAWHAGLRVNTTAELFRTDYPHLNPNLITIGIEHEGSARDELTPEQLEASAQLHVSLHRRLNIPLTQYFVINHREIRADKTCPGRIDTLAILKRANELISPETTTPTPRVPLPGTRVWSDYYKEHLIVTHYLDDNRWRFIRESHLTSLGTLAQTPFSQMPPAR